MNIDQSQYSVNDLLSVTRSMHAATESGDWNAVNRYDLERIRMLQNLKPDPESASIQGKIEELQQLDKSMLSVVEARRKELANTMSELSDRKKIEQAYSK